MDNFYTDNEHLKFHLNHPLMEKIVKLKEKNYTEKEKHDYAPLDLEDALDSYDKVLEIIGEISGDIIAPNAESVDHEGPQLIDNEVVYARGTQENHDALVKAGMIGMSLPREYGGLNFPIVPYVMSAEIVSRADAGFAISGDFRIVLRPSMSSDRMRLRMNIFRVLTRVQLQPWILPNPMPDPIFRPYS